MEVKELLKEIPAETQYSLKVEYSGYRFCCHLDILKGNESIKFSGFSHELEKAIDAIHESMKSRLKS